MQIRQFIFKLCIPILVPQAHTDQQRELVGHLQGAWIFITNCKHSLIVWKEIYTGEHADAILLPFSEKWGNLNTDILCLWAAIINEVYFFEKICILVDIATNRNYLCMAWCTFITSYTFSFTLRCLQWLEMAV